MKRILPYIMLSVALTLCVPVVAQQQGQGQGQGQQPPTPPAPPAQPAAPPAPPVNVEEENAYKAFFDMRAAEPAALIAAAEDFLSKFPESRYRESVYSKLTQAYLNLGQLDKLVVSAEKALELNPNNVDVLSVISYGMLRRFNPGDLDAEQKLTKAEDYAKRGIELLNKLEKPLAMTDEDFARAKNDKLAMCRSGLGLAYLHRQRWADSAAELEQATQLTSAPDPTDIYLLGAAYQNSKRFKEAADTFGRCAEIQWVWQERCKVNADRAKKLAESAPKP